MAWAFAIVIGPLDKLIIINAPHPGVLLGCSFRIRSSRPASQYMRMFCTPEAEEILSRDHYLALQDVLLNTESFDEADRQAYLEAWSQPGALTGGLNYYRAARLLPPPPGTPLPKTSLELDVASLTVRVPTLVIWGERDRALTPQNLNGLEQFVPDLTVRRIPDANHWVVHQKPELVNGYIREFLES